MAGQHVTKRQYGLRTVLLLVMLSALLLVISIIGGVSLHRLQGSLERAYRSQREFETKQLEARTQQYLAAVEQQSALNHQLLVDGVLSMTDLPGLAHQWVSVMKQQLQLSSLSVSLSATGELLEVARLPDGQLSVRHLAPDPATGHLRARDYWPADFPARPYHEITNQDAGDPRQRPWFRQAVAAGRSVWTPTYEFIGAGDSGNRLGVTHAAPFYGPRGELRGVLTTDIALGALNQILAEIIPPREGVGLIVERLPDGKPKLLAQSDIRRWRELLPAKLRASLGSGNIGAQLAGKLGEAWLQHDSFDRRVDLSSGELLLSVITLGDVRQPGAHPPWALVLLSPPDAYLVGLRRDVRVLAILTLLIVGIAAGLSLALAQNIARPLTRLARQLERYGRLELDEIELHPSSILEVGQLGHSSQSMALGLRSFLKYVPASLVRQLVAGGEEAHLGGEERELSVMFVDVAGFTKLSETLSPTDLVGLLGGMNEMLANEIEAQGGTLDKFLGDGLMALWGAPEARPDHATEACRAALQIKAHLQQVNALRREAGRIELRMRIGLASGLAVVGNFGSSHRISYTAVGDVVNTAAALEQLNKVYGTTMLLNASIVHKLTEDLPLRLLDKLKLKGKQQAQVVYQLLPRLTAAAESAHQVDMLQAYAAALELYFDGQWSQALVSFEAYHAAYPDDEPGRVMLERCRRFQLSPPPHWDGSFELARIVAGAG